MAAAAALRPGGAGHPRTKSEICVYKTTDGKVIVEDELLNFIVVKMRTLAQDEIVLLVTNNFSSAWIEESKRLLFEMCPTSIRCVKHKGPQKDSNNIKDCLRVLNECGDNIPRFVSYNLDELPPIGFEHLDASALLSRVQQLSREVVSLKAILEAQMSTSDSVSAATTAMEHRVAALEKQCQRAPPGQTYGGAGQTQGIPSSVPPMEKQAATTSARFRGETDLNVPLSDSGPEELLSAPTHAEWSTVVKRGRHTRPNAPLQPQQNRSKREQRRKAGIIGTGTASNIPVVKTKLVSVFATRFSPELDADTLGSYLSERLGKAVTCEKIQTVRNNRFGSFRVLAECNEVGELYDAQLWPEGIYVRRYYEARKPRASIAQSLEAKVEGSALLGDSPAPRCSWFFRHINYMAEQEQNKRTLEQLKRLELEKQLECNDAHKAVQAKEYELKDAQEAVQGKEQEVNEAQKAALLKEIELKDIQKEILKKEKEELNVAPTVVQDTSGLKLKRRSVRAPGKYK
ncbi:hypothetical protein WMY93_014359 [Mugilogobius chulae]|uniref:RRM domain-containing protein n=1 Tax=Mugilogobius chulae TaxID=88201 RepID=A0AAW0NYI7_9GOBI